MNRKPYPSDVSDEEWSFVAPDFTLMMEDAPQREHDLREVFNGLRWIVRTGAQWRMMPHDLSPWSIVSQQTQRWLKAGCFEAIVNDLHAVLRLDDPLSPPGSRLRTLAGDVGRSSPAGFCDAHTSSFYSFDGSCFISSQKTLDESADQ